MLYDSELASLSIPSPAAIEPGVAWLRIARIVDCARRSRHQEQAVPSRSPIIAKARSNTQAPAKEQLEPDTREGLWNHFRGDAFIPSTMLSIERMGKRQARQSRGRALRHPWGESRAIGN